MAKNVITVDPDPGPAQTVQISAKQKALAAIAQIKKEIANLEQTVRSIQEVKAPKGAGAQTGGGTYGPSKRKAAGS